jgi:hypothetical protein
MLKLSAFVGVLTNKYNLGKIAVGENTNSGKAFTKSEQTDKLEFSLSVQSKGTYILKVKKGDRFTTQKLVY